MSGHDRRNLGAAVGACSPAAELGVLRAVRELDTGGILTPYQLPLSPPPQPRGGEATHLGHSTRIILRLLQHNRHDRQFARVEIRMHILRQPQHIPNTVRARRRGAQGHPLKMVRGHSSFEHSNKRPEVGRFLGADRERQDVAGGAETGDARDDARAVVARGAGVFDGGAAGGAGCCGALAAGAGAAAGTGLRDEGFHAVDEGCDEIEEGGRGGQRRGDRVCEMVHGSGGGEALGGGEGADEQ